MRTVISDLQALRNTLDSCIEQDSAQQGRDIQTHNDDMVSYWQGRLDAQKSFRNHLQAIIASELQKVYGDHIHTQACYGVDSVRPLCGKL